jgi:hypothetical protein
VYWHHELLKQLFSASLQISDHFGEHWIRSDQAFEVGPAGLGVNEARTGLQSLGDVVRTVGCLESFEREDG